MIPALFRRPASGSPSPTRSAAARRTLSRLARDVVIPELPKFFERYPKIEVEIIGVDRKVDLIREGIDCTIRGGPVDAGLGAIDLDLGAGSLWRYSQPSDRAPTATRRSCIRRGGACPVASACSSSG